MEAPSLLSSLQGCSIKRRKRAGEERSQRAAAWGCARERVEERFVSMMQAEGEQPRQDMGRAGLEASLVPRAAEGISAGGCEQGRVLPHPRMQNPSSLFPCCCFWMFLLAAERRYLTTEPPHWSAPHPPNATLKQSCPG